MEKIFGEDFVGLSQSALRNFRNSVTVKGSLLLAGGDFDSNEIVLFE